MTHSPLCIGIDPGLSGYIALVSPTEVIFAHPTPTVKMTKGGKRDYDVPAMCSLLRRYASHTRYLAIEQQQVAVRRKVKKGQGRPEQGVAQTFKIGYGYGLWIACVNMLGITHYIAHPRTWQSFAHRGVGGTDTKAKSILICQRLYPQQSLLRTPKCTKPDDNMADAILIGRWGLSQMMALPSSAPTEVDIFS